LEAPGIGECEPISRRRLYKIAHSARFPAKRTTRKFNRVTGPQGHLEDERLVMEFLKKIAETASRSTLILAQFFFGQRTAFFGQPFVDLCFGDRNQSI
jgi:hypothetical protein